MTARSLHALSPTASGGVKGAIGPVGKCCGETPWDAIGAGGTLSWWQKAGDVSQRFVCTHISLINYVCLFIYLTSFMYLYCVLMYGYKYYNNLQHLTTYLICLCDLFHVMLTDIYYTSWIISSFPCRAAHKISPATNVLPPFCRSCSAIPESLVGDFLLCPTGTSDNFGTRDQRFTPWPSAKRFLSHWWACDLDGAIPSWKKSLQDKQTW